MEPSAEEQRKLHRARKKVKAISGFYRHFVVYLVVNTILIIIRWANMQPGENFLTWQTFSTACFWGIGLLCHGFAVFGTDFMFGADWEERKIKKYMGDDNPDRQRWE